VDTHRNNLMKKLRIKNTAGLVRYALEQGLTASTHRHPPADPQTMG